MRPIDFVKDEPYVCDLCDARLSLVGYMECGKCILSEMKIFYKRNEFYTGFNKNSATRTYTAMPRNTSRISEQISYYKEIGYATP